MKNIFLNLAALSQIEYWFDQLNSNEYSFYFQVYIPRSNVYIYIQYIYMAVKNVSKLILIYIIKIIMQNKFCVSSQNINLCVTK